MSHHDPLREQALAIEMEERHPLETIMERARRHYRKATALAYPDGAACDVVPWIEALPDDTDAFELADLITAHGPWIGGLTGWFLACETIRTAAWHEPDDAIVEFTQSIYADALRRLYPPDQYRVIRTGVESLLRDHAHIVMPHATRILVDIVMRGHRNAKAFLMQTEVLERIPIDVDITAARCDHDPYLEALRVTGRHNPA